MRTVAVLPVKVFSEAKQRLGATYEPEPRVELARAMVRDVVSALAASSELLAAVMVTSDATAAALARTHGLAVVPEGLPSGHSAAATMGVRRAVELGAERVLLVPGDCPGLTADDIDDLLKRHRNEGVVIVPDRHGAGTNALLLAPPTVIAPAFGEGSCRRHRTAAANAGVACAIDPVPSLALDVDNGEDLDALRAAVCAGAQTLAALDRLAART